MNKYNIRLPSGQEFSLFCDTIEEVLKKANIFCDSVITENDITIDTKKEYLKYINEIISNSDGEIYINNKKHYLYKSNYGLIPVHILEQDDFQFDGLQYIEGTYNKQTNEIKPFEGSFIFSTGWIMSNPEVFLNKFNPNNDIKFIQYSIRHYGQPKLIMPKELKGIKQWGNVDYIPKHCACKVYIKDNDVWIKHRDYFSPSMKTKIEDIGTPLSYKAKKYLGKTKTEKFIYPDTWGDIVLRSEAWLKIENLMLFIKRNENNKIILNKILRQMEEYLHFSKYVLDCGDMDRMFEELIKKLKAELINN